MNVSYGRFVLFGRKVSEMLKIGNCITGIRTSGENNEAEGFQHVSGKMPRAGCGAGCGVHGASTGRQDALSEHGPA
jgi:hypothetical protein